MKTLLLLRHAKSSWEYPYLEDRLRPLNKRGKTDAPLIGEYIAKAGIIPEVMYASSAVRCVATANLVQSKFKLDSGQIYFRDNLYTFSDNGDLYLSYPQASDDTIDTIMVVGHNDTCFNLAHRLLPGFDSKFPTCACLAVYWNTNNWNEIGVANARLHFYITPKMLK